MNNDLKLASVRSFFGLLAILGCLWPTSVRAQADVIGSVGSINRPTPRFGFNGTGFVPAGHNGSQGANWTQQAFIDSVAVLGPEIIRIPGGTNANHWDWQSGWFRPGFIPPGTQLAVHLEDFKKGLDASTAEGLFVLNLETSSVDYEMDGLRTAHALGMDPNLFELGNEHNLDGGQAYPDQLMTSAAYADLAKPFHDAVKAEFPGAKVGAVGGNTGLDPLWHATILNQIPNLDAFAFHVYLTADNADLAFNVNRALAIPFGPVDHNKTLDFRFNRAGFAALPAGKEVWVTEYNLDEIQLSSVPVIAGTWTHLLYNTAFNHYFLTKDNVTMILNHTLGAAATRYESISIADHHITANGLSIKLLADVSRGSETAQNIVFSGNLSMTYLSATIPKLIGWKFNSATGENGFIANFSPDTLIASLSSVFPRTMSYDQFFADTSMVVSGLSSLGWTKGSTADQISIMPFSITQIRSPFSTTGLNKERETENLPHASALSISLYPNPAEGTISATIPDGLGPVDAILYNAIGQEVARVPRPSDGPFSFSTYGLKAGVYLLVIRNGDQVAVGKFIVQ